MALRTGAILDLRSDCGVTRNIKAEYEMMLLWGALVLVVDPYQRVGHWPIGIVFCF